MLAEMAIQNVPNNPFCIIPAGGQGITKPQESWIRGNSATFVFTITYDQNKPF